MRGPAASARARSRAACVLCAAAALLAPRPARALINPNFTPIHLVGQSDRILVLKLGPVGAQGAIPVQLVRCAKGRAPAEPPALDLSQTAKPQAEALRQLIGSRQSCLALLFSGEFQEVAAAGGGQGPRTGGEGFLHVGGQWFHLVGRKPGTWMVDVLDTHKEGTWAGGTDMLLRAVDYVLTDPDATVPTRTGANWAKQTKIATVEGTVHGALAVDLVGPPAVAPPDAADRRLALHILSDAGDRLLRWDPQQKAFADLTPKLKLSTRSRLATWGSFFGGRHSVLVSSSGKHLSFWQILANGEFSECVSLELEAEPMGLSVLAVSTKGRPGIVVSTAGYPLLLAPEGASDFAVAPVVEPPAGKFLGASLGAARPCLVADFDADGIADILQPFAKGILFYKGKGLGAFNAPTRSEAVGTGPGAAGAFLGDYDADGLLDVFVGAEERCLLWHNRGGGRFEETLHLTGEAAYISKPNAIGGMTGDANNDGRQDVLILYADRAPQIFFNRGFRSFGHSHMLDLAEKQLLPAADEGQQAGLLADLNGDGGQDMALVLRNGEVWVFFRDAEGLPALCLRAALPVGGPFAGPLTAVGWTGKRCLGAWNVVPGTAEAFFGVYEPGPTKLCWQFPGGKPREQEILVEEGPVRFLLKP